ncbi:pre-mrna splicing factor 24 [Gigaspora margarita]|uniref:Pre-mrna splicing factor 24 n=1 Tax=Gigaspora margarita TaxID=4874 RepID=A0A8H4AJ05_GIGMA|nr:pre-mrna splicing factor 24 [Gigaspora margarita]
MNVDVNVDVDVDVDVDVEEIQQLLEQLSSNCYQYDVHVRYIQALRQAALFDELKDAREMMHGIFPLSEDIWLEWIQDESRLASTKEEKQRVIHLYSEAVKDYLSIKLWKEYINYIIQEYKNFLEEMDETGDNSGEVATLEQVRSVFTEAIKKTGNVVPESHIVWDACKEFEEQILEASSRDEVQKQRVQKMYTDRLKVPHATVEKTFSDYSSFITKYDNSNYEKCMVESNMFFSQAKRRYYERDHYEQALVASGNALDKYMEYIEFEKRQSTPNWQAIRTLYERAIVFHYLDSSLWENYIFQLIDKKFPIDMVLSVIERSVRNCPWSGDLWGHYVRVLEKECYSYDKIKNIVQRALSTGMLNNSIDELVKVLLAHCDFERRRIMKPLNSENTLNLINIIQESLQTVKQSFPSGDPNYRLEKYLIEIETLNKNLTKAREIWEDIIKAHGREAEAWLRYIEWERFMGNHDGLMENHDEIHKKFKRASQQNTDWPERIFDAWEQFEHQYGTLDSMEHAFMFIKKQMKIVAHRRAKNASLEVQNVGSEQVFQESTTFNDTQAAWHSEASQSSKVSQPEISEPAQHPEKQKRDREFTTIVASNLPLDVTEGQLKALFNECGKIVSIHLIEDTEKAQKSAHIEFAKREDVPAALTKDKKKIGDHEINVYKITEHTLFITNFPETANLKEIFDKYGKIIGIRYPNKSYRAGRFCYIEYENRESALSALEMNGFEIEQGKKLNVMISNPSLKKTRSPPRQNEIFIKNLPSHVERSELETLCKTYGPVIGVRIPTTKDKKCKGFAFVEFDNEEHAKTALALHNTEFKACLLHVTLSNIDRDHGQKKSTSGEPNNKETKNKDSKPISTPMMPRKLQKPSMRLKLSGPINRNSKTNQS